MKKIELLAPAGDIEKAKIAINFGASALYLGAKLYSLRAKSNNFDINELKQIIQLAHKVKRKIYVVVNVLCHNNLVKDFKKNFDKIAKCKPDGFIVADPFIVQTINKYYPEYQIHISTQQSVTNSKAALFFKKQGATRIILAREINKKDLYLMAKRLKNIIELEYFIHGALCISYSGKCTMSNHFCLRDANIGGCAQCCRWEWSLFDDKNKLISKQFNLSSKDLNLSQYIPQLVDSGLQSLKIEGRNKSIHYLATVVNQYRNIIDKSYQNKLTKKTLLLAKNELKKAEKRPTSTGWFDGDLNNKKLNFISNANKNNVRNNTYQNFVFTIEKKNKKCVYTIIAKNYFNLNDKFESFGPTHKLIKFKIKKILDLKTNEFVNSANRPMSNYTIYTDSNLICVNDLVRKIN